MGTSVIEQGQSKSAPYNDGFNGREITSPLSVSASPNPASHYVELTYELSAIDNNGIITITDMHGRLIKVISIDDAKGVYAWDIRNINPGTYLYRLQTKYFAKSGKLIIQ